MTAGEVRDRLDHRFRLLVGSRRGLERHQTLRHAVQWSYDLLANRKRLCWTDVRCSPAASTSKAPALLRVPMTNSPSLDLLDALVRKSLLVADRSAGRTGSRCWRRSASSPRTNLSLVVKQTGARTAHARYFAGREADVMSLWDSPGSARPTTGSRPNWPTCAPRFAGRPTMAISTWPRDYRRLRDVPRRTCAENYEPSPGQKNSSNPPARPTTPDLLRSMSCVAVLHGRTARGGGPLRRGRPGCRQSQTAGRRAVSASKAGSAMVTLFNGQPERCGRGGVAQRSGARPRYPHAEPGMH